MSNSEKIKKYFRCKIRCKSVYCKFWSNRQSGSNCHCRDRCQYLAGDQHFFQSFSQILILQTIQNTVRKHFRCKKCADNAEWHRTSGIGHLLHGNALLMRSENWNTMITVVEVFFQNFIEFQRLNNDKMWYKCQKCNLFDQSSMKTTFSSIKMIAKQSEFYLLSNFRIRMRSCCAIAIDHVFAVIMNVIEQVALPIKWI